jgi:hypothetical protein
VRRAEDARDEDGGSADGNAGCGSPILMSGVGRTGG